MQSGVLPQLCPKYDWVTWEVILFKKKKKIFHTFCVFSDRKKIRKKRNEPIVWFEHTKLCKLNNVDLIQELGR